MTTFTYLAIAGGCVLFGSIAIACAIFAGMEVSRSPDEMLHGDESAWPHERARLQQEFEQQRRQAATGARTDE